MGRGGERELLERSAPALALELSRSYVLKS